MKENFKIEDVDTALIYFDLNTKAGSNIGISRRDRLDMHYLLSIDVSAQVAIMICELDWVGDYIYNDSPLIT